MINLKTQTRTAGRTEIVNSSNDSLYFWPTLPGLAPTISQRTPYLDVQGQDQHYPRLTEEALEWGTWHRPSLSSSPRT